MEVNNVNDVDIIAGSTEKLLARSISLREFIQLLGPRLTSNDPEEREKAIELVVSVLCKLGSDFLDSKEVELLLDFLLGRFDESALAGGAVVAGIKHLVLSSSKIPVGCEKLVAQKVFIDGSVQDWGQKDRFALFQVLEYFVTKRLEGIRSMGVEFLLGFIRSMTGERDPRCLVIAFRLFCKVVRLFSLGPFVEDVFDVVACYYPIEFKPSSGDTTGITRDLLMSGCEECLVASPSFAPFTYQLIAEKLDDDELDEDTKLEVCSFLARACDIFPAIALRGQLDDILAQLRMVAFNPATKSAIMPTQIMTAIQAITTKLSSGLEEGPVGIDHICEDFLENCEPFILQCEMGMCGRSLTLLEFLASCHSKMTKTVIEKVLGWLLMLVKGETVNSAANRDEVIDEGFKYLPRWCKLASSTGNDSLVLCHQQSLLKEIRKCESKTTCYPMGEVFVSLQNADNAMTAYYDELLTRSLKDSINDDSDLRNSCLSFIHEFAIHNWNLLAKLLASRVDCIRGNCSIVPILCAAVCSMESMQFILPFLQPLLSQPQAWSATNLQNLLAVFSCNKSQQDLCEILFRHMFSSLMLASDDALSEHSVALAECIQDIGLSLHTEFHLSIMRFLAEHIEMRPVLLLLVYLFIVQSEDVEEISTMLSKLPPSGMEWQKVVLMGAIVNKAGDFERRMEHFDVICSKFSKESQFRYKGVMCRQLLLVDRSQGWAILETLLDDLKNHPEDELLLSTALCECVDFDSRWSDISKCAYHSTVLARQRIFYQILPILVRHFNQLQSGNLVGPRYLSLILERTQSRRLHYQGEKLKQRETEFDWDL
ncbi:unnamed protein product [Toxocara canis]|uniref:MMS19 nucleotide excision repair protein n=1 Tax=Toxocara canis TaxID=6265 RepID=A0A183UZT4_TOXCA|nr:unnamed protein product [Toxocara canis]